MSIERQIAPKPALPGRSATFPLLQRKCACGGSASPEGECEECKQNAMSLQRRAGCGGSAPAAVPPIVHDVLRSPGRPLDAATRAFMEPRFGHDFSRVRVHADGHAAQSARAVNALAYTAGSRIVFDSGQYAPRSSNGRSLLAHELAHVVQQSGLPGADQPRTIAPANDPGECEADRVASAVGSAPARPTLQNRPQLMRKLRVLNPSQTIPDPTGQGVKQTNAATVKQYLEKQASGSGVTVDPTTGKVDLPTGYCPGILGGALRGASSWFNATMGVVGKIPLLGPLIGLGAGLVGGVVGGLRGLFGSDLSEAASSSTPTGSTCLCDLIDSSQDWKVHINDTFPDPKHPHPVTGDHETITTVSPNNPYLLGAAEVSGKLQNVEPWLAFSHELCGHAWLETKSIEETRQPVPHAFKDTSTGKMKVLDGPPTKESPGPHEHERSVERENLIRKEHNLAPRGWRLKDPYCGESFMRDKAAPGGPPQWYPNSGYPGFNTTLEQCQYLRSLLPESKTHQYGIEEAIP